MFDSESCRNIVKLNQIKDELIFLSVVINQLRETLHGQIELGKQREKQLDSSDRVERVMHRVGDDGLHSGQHKRVRSVHEVGMVALWC